jgi:MFS transporter, SP family, major inositol transporter
LTSPTRPRTPLPPLTSGPHRRRIGVISVVACFGGLLFGYDTGVSNGAETAMQAELGLSDLSLGIVISSLVFAAAVGAFLGGRLSDEWGRRRTITAMAVLFFAGTLCVVFSPGFAVLVLGRVLLGLAVGAASTVVPVYLAELAPFEIRGSITGRNELAIVSGQLAAFVVNAVLGTTLGHLDGVWRLMFAVCALPAVALFVGMLRVPESPRWLVDHGKFDEAVEVLRTVRSPERAEAEARQIADTTYEDSKRVAMDWRGILGHRWLRRVLLVGIGVAMAQQLTGINSIMYYGQRVLIEAGFTADAALVANIASGVFAVVGGLIALRNMDRVDRRTTFAIGLSLTTSCHVLIGIASIALPADNPLRPYVLLVLIVAFVFSMQSFLNVAVWVWLAEVFPLRMRGLAIGVAVFFGWTTNGVLALFFPSLVDAIGISGVFFLFAGVGAVALLFVLTQVPETRAVSLEALEEGVLDGSVFDVRATR